MNHFCFSCMIFFCLVLVGCTETGTEPQDEPFDYSSVWTATVSDYLTEPLWLARDTNDACHALMVPLHASFSWQKSSWQQDFHSHFTDFYDHRDDLDTGRLNRLHYLLFAARYLVLSVESGSLEKLPTGFYTFLSQTIIELWQDPAWHWAFSDFESMEERLIWKLENIDAEPSYYRAITDEEKFMFSMAADISIYCANTDSVCPQPIADILDWAEVVFTTEIQDTDVGGWLFQAGVWTDHRDFAYAGNDSMHQDIQPIIVEGLSADASHSHRDALELQSLMQASEPGSDRYLLYRDLLDRLAVQFLEVVVGHPYDESDAVFLRNFMDGGNGVYRWGYETQGLGRGYGPWQLSDTFNLGWWAFLDNSEVTAMYSTQADQFPLPQWVVDTYVGPNTTRDRHPLIVLPDPYYNGFNLLTIKLAAKLRG